MQQENGNVVAPQNSGIGGVTKVRRRTASKRYEVCLIEELATHEEARQSRTVVGAAFEQSDGRLKAVLKPGISVSGTLEFLPVLRDA